MAVSLERHTIDTHTYHRMIETGILSEHDQVELIHGEIIKISPVSKEHIAAIDRITNLIKERIGKNAIVRTQSPIHIPKHSEPEPDVTLLKPRSDFYASTHAKANDIYLIIEVAQTSLDYDYEIKRPLYASAGITELWLVNLNKHEIEVHRTPAPGTYKNISILQSGDAVALPVPGIETTLTVDELLGTLTKEQLVFPQFTTFTLIK